MAKRGKNASVENHAVDGVDETAARSDDTPVGSPTAGDASSGTTASDTAPATFLDALAAEICRDNEPSPWLAAPLAAGAVVASRLGVVRLAPTIMHNVRYGTEHAALAGTVIGLIGHADAQLLRTGGGRGAAATATPPARPVVPVFPSVLAAVILGVRYGGARKSFPLATGDSVPAAAALALALARWMDVFVAELSGIEAVWTALGDHLQDYRHLFGEYFALVKSVLQSCSTTSAADATHVDGLLNTAQMAQTLRRTASVQRWHVKVMEVLKTHRSSTALLKDASPDMLMLLVMLLSLDTLVAMLYGETEGALKQVQARGQEILTLVEEYTSEIPAEAMTTAAATAAILPAGTKAVPNASLDKLAAVNSCLDDLVWLTTAAHLAAKTHAGGCDWCAAPVGPLQPFFDTTTREVACSPWLQLPTFGFDDVQPCVAACLAGLKSSDQRLLRESQRKTVLAQGLLNAGGPIAARRALELLNDAIDKDAGASDTYFHRARALLALAPDHEARCQAADKEWKAKDQAARDAATAAQTAEDAAKASAADVDVKSNAVTASTTRAREAQASVSAAEAALAKADAAAPAAADGAAPTLSAEQQAAQTAVQNAKSAEAAASAERTKAEQALAEARRKATSDKQTATTKRAEADRLQAAAQRPPLAAGPAMKSLRDINLVVALRSFTWDADTMKLRADAIAAVRQELARRAAVNGRDSDRVESVLADEKLNVAFVARHRCLARLLAADADAFSSVTAPAEVL